jgi:hypothetical protein
MGVRAGPRGWLCCPGHLVGAADLRWRPPIRQSEADGSAGRLCPALGAVLFTAEPVPFGIGSRHGASPDALASCAGPGGCGFRW